MIHNREGNPMQIDIEHITPTRAEEMLAANVHNRDVRKRHVQTLAEAMRRGEWAANGDSIKFARTGTLLDGQHRLLAVVESGVTITMPVVRGLAPETQATMDTHAKRKFSDVLKLRGEVSCVQLAGALMVLWKYNNGELRGNMRVPSYAQMLDLLETNPGLRDSVRVAGRVAACVKFSPSMLAAAHWIFSSLDSEDAEFFFARLADGVDLNQDDPIRRLREVMIQNATSNSRFNNLYLFALTFKAWNAYRDAVPVKVLRWRLGGSAPEDFPAPI
ncbi:hypothetical protein GCM10017673_40280 [Streptosporangium violaceochromogenes]|nr:hypothetical protein GCM10017673_40280 [Streptosporangium violaceochromogenes]